MNKVIALTGNEFLNLTNYIGITPLTATVKNLGQSTVFLFKNPINLEDPSFELGTGGEVELTDIAHDVLICCNKSQSIMVSVNTDKSISSLYR